MTLWALFWATLGATFTLFESAYKARGWATGKGTTPISFAPSQSQHSSAFNSPFTILHLIILHFNTMSSINDQSPQLPPELFEEIISHAWNLSLSNEERIAFMTSSMLVSKSWQHAFQLVAWKDAYIPNRSYISYIHDNRALFNPHTQSISFRIDAKDNSSHSVPAVYYASNQIERDDWLVPTSAKSDYPIGQALASFTYDCWCEADLLPHLRAMHVHYVDVPAPYNDLFLRITEFPSQVEELYLTFEFNDPTLLREFPEWSYIPLHDHLQLGGVKKLFITGCGKRFLADMKSVCPNLEVLVVDGTVVKV